MPYVGGKVADWFKQGPAVEAAHHMAARGTHEMRVLVEAKTPKDTGELSASWVETPVTPGVSIVGHATHEGRVETEVDYAPYVEYGTGLWGPKHMKYPIRPKVPGGVLHFFTKGGHEVFTKLVMHPGSPGAHMVRDGVAALEAALMGGLFDDDIKAFLEAQVALNHSSVQARIAAL